MRKYLGFLMFAGVFAHAETPLTRHLGCENFESTFWSGVYRLSLGAPTPMPSVATPLEERIERFGRYLAFEAPRELGARSRGEIQEVVTGFELGDRTTPLKRKIQRKIRTELRVFRNLAPAVKDCPSPEVAASRRVPARLGAAGARDVMATLYQSCEVLQAPPMTAFEPAIEGITITGLHPDGIGNRRFIADLAAVNRTHYYLRRIEGPTKECVDVRRNPPIYDYGGKPNPDEGDLNFFRDAGSGTTVLGTDCSGYVFSALAVKGLKMKRESPLKAEHVFGLSSSMMADPATNGLSCLARVKFEPGVSIEVGDLVASRGHVAIVDAVGRDPFGLERARTIDDCREDVLSIDGFDFTILQSSTHQEGSGVNRMPASEALVSSEKFRVGLLRQAIEACRGRFGAKVTVPETEAYVIRHLTKDGCAAAPLAMRGSACAASCR